VVLVGYGPSAGQGEEGRLAWNLLYLGFQDVQIAGVEVLRKSMTHQASPPAQNVALWRAEPRSDLQMGKNEFLNLALNPKLRLEQRVHIVDVRSAKEFLNKVPGKRKLPDITAINIEWRDFFTRDGRVDAKFRTRLSELGILPKDQVIVVSNRGVRSGAAAYALLAMGYVRVQNFTGGWNSLLSSGL
jgi:thiosulfate/3-mercaptopyruvate sulfurtransferase